MQDNTQEKQKQDFLKNTQNSYFSYNKEELEKKLYKYKKIQESLIGDKGIEAKNMLEAALKYAEEFISKGYIFKALYEHKDIDNKIIYGRVIFDHPETYDRWNKAICLDDKGYYHLSEPDYSEWHVEKSLYGLRVLAKYKNAHIWIVEVEDEGNHVVQNINDYFARNNIQNLHMGLKYNAKKDSNLNKSLNDNDWMIIYA